MPGALRISISVFLLAITAAAQSQREAPATVHIVTGANATALYHREGCAALRAGPTARLTLAEAQKRFFQPHCLCIAGEEGAPPCEVAAAAVGAAAAGAATTATAAAAANASETVYATRTGTKYHRARCRSLSRSQIPMTLKEASARYGACSICRPPVLTEAGAPATAAGVAAAAPLATTPVERVTPAPAKPAAAVGRCQATTKAGRQCSRRAQPGRSFCWQH